MLVSVLDGVFVPKRWWHHVRSGGCSVLADSTFWMDTREGVSGAPLGGRHLPPQMASDWNVMGTAGKLRFSAL